MGLNWNDGDQVFAGEWEVNGCFYYESWYADGYYDGRAYFGTGGPSESKLSTFCVDDIHVRIGGCEEVCLDATTDGKSKGSNVDPWSSGLGIRRLQNVDEEFMSYDDLFTMFSENAGDICFDPRQSQS
jgi:hypothetical protein